MLFFLCTNAVPSAPLNVTYRNLSSTEIEVSWLPPADPNGIIDNYTLMYTLNDSMNISGILELSYNLTSLMPYLQYVIVVYALTDKGQGIGSDSLVVLTDEDCELLLMNAMVIYCQVPITPLYFSLCSSFCT